MPYSVATGLVVFHFNTLRYTPPTDAHFAAAAVAGRWEASVPAFGGTFCSAFACGISSWFCLYVSLPCHRTWTLPFPRGLPLHTAYPQLHTLRRARHLHPPSPAPHPPPPAYHGLYFPMCLELCNNAFLPPPPYGSACRCRGHTSPGLFDLLWVRRSVALFRMQRACLVPLLPYSAFSVGAIAVGLPQATYRFLLFLNWTLPAGSCALRTTRRDIPVVAGAHLLHCARLLRLNGRRTWLPTPFPRSISPPHPHTTPPFRRTQVLPRQHCLLLHTAAITTYGSIIDIIASYWRGKAILLYISSIICWVVSGSSGSMDAARVAPFLRGGFSLRWVSLRAPVPRWRTRTPRRCHAHSAAFAVAFYRLAAITLVYCHFPLPAAPPRYAAPRGSRTLRRAARHAGARTLPAPLPFGYCFFMTQNIYILCRGTRSPLCSSSRDSILTPPPF